MPGHSTRSEQLRQTAAAAEQVAREIERALSAHPGAQENGDELRIAERFRPEGQKPLARPLGCRPVGDPHVG